MALLANVRDSFGASPRYIYIRDFTVSRATGVVTGKLDIYADQATRDCLKAADASLIALHSQVTAKQGEIDSAVDEYRKLTHDDQAATRDAFNASIEAMRTAAEALKEQVSAQRQIFDANQPGLRQDFTIPPGAVTVQDNGSVAVGDLYTWLKSDRFPDGTEV